MRNYIFIFIFIISSSVKSEENIYQEIEGYQVGKSLKFLTEKLQNLTLPKNRCIELIDDQSQYLTCQKVSSFENAKNFLPFFADISRDNLYNICSTYWSSRYISIDDYNNCTPATKSIDGYQQNQTKTEKLLNQKSEKPIIKYVQSKMKNICCKDDQKCHEAFSRIKYSSCDSSTDSSCEKITAYQQKPSNQFASLNDILIFTSQNDPIIYKHLKSIVDRKLYASPNAPKFLEGFTYEINKIWHGKMKNLFKKRPIVGEVKILINSRLDQKDETYWRNFEATLWHEYGHACSDVKRLLKIYDKNLLKNSSKEYILSSTAFFEYNFGHKCEISPYIFHEYEQLMKNLGGDEELSQCLISLGHIADIGAGGQ